MHVSRMNHRSTLSLAETPAKTPPSESGAAPGIAGDDRSARREGDVSFAAARAAGNAREETRLRVLVVEDNPGDARLVQEMLLETRTVQFDVTHVDRLEKALAVLREEAFDAMLLDLGLPDAGGLDTLTPINNAVPDLPVVVLSGLTDESLAVQAVQLGAQDYLVKGSGDGTVLARTLRYAIERKRSEEYITHIANHDSLTNLPNRRLLLDRLAQALTRARRNGSILALLFLDLDHFKSINDSLGHSVGDLLLQAVAKRLKACIRESDTVARLGGDDFTLVVPDIAHVEDVVRFVQKIRTTLESRFLIGRHELFVSASIGVSLYPEDAGDPETLLRHADAAMYRSKQKGRNTYDFYSVGGAVQGSENLALGVALRHALDRREFAIHYQPQVDVATSKIVGMEALLRWRSSDHGLVPPAQFIALAEESGLIVPIGEWVLRHVCTQVQTWRERAASPLRVAVNLSSRQFGQSNLLGMIVHVLRETGLPPRYLELELTESGMMYNESAAASILKQLKAIGIRLTIDDFGTGYSSLIRLKRFPIDALKIDQGFVHDMTSDPLDAAIVKSIVFMAHGLRMNVIAEGVETSRQLAFLKKLRCDQAQGHYISPPLPGEDLGPFLREARMKDRS